MKIKEKKYFVYENGDIGYLDSICDCDKCVERDAAEIFINHLDGSYLDCRNVNSLPEDVVYFGDSIEEGTRKLADFYKSKLDTDEIKFEFYQALVDVYEKELVRKKENYDGVS